MRIRCSRGAVSPNNHFAIIAKHKNAFSYSCGKCESSPSVLAYSREYCLARLNTFKSFTSLIILRNRAREPRARVLHAGCCALSIAPYQYQLLAAECRHSIDRHKLSSAIITLKS